VDLPFVAHAQLPAKPAFSGLEISS
jgi:hypothetical protein